MTTLRKLALVVLAALPAPGVAAAAQQPPDLVSDPPTTPYLESHASQGAPTRLLLRLNGYVHNIGPGPLHVEGNPSVAGGVFQWILDNGTLTKDSALPVLFETNDDHNHFHLMKATEYSLWNEARTGKVAPAEKVGFCLYDSQRRETDRGPASKVYDDPTFCQQGHPGATTLKMGVSAGWRDIYSALLALQWVDVSNTAPGRYWTASRADPDNVIAEADNQNPYGFGTDLVTVPGYVAQPVSATASAPGAPVTVTLAAATYDDPQAFPSPDPSARVSSEPGPRTFRIVAPPANGTLDHPMGTNFSADTVTYTPNGGFRGTDTFTYAAVDSTSPFPRTPPAAAATVTVEAPAPVVTISGAPASLVAGTSVQLRASVVNAPGGVVWTVGGVPAGAPAGSVTPAGLYTAPATTPAGGAVTVRATNPGTGAFGEAAIRIAPKPPQIPAPAPGEPPAVTGSPLPARPRASVRGRWLTVRATAPQTGTVLLKASAGRRALLRCRVAGTRGRAVSCSVRLGRTAPVGRVVASARMASRSAAAELARPRIEIREGYVTARALAGHAGTVLIAVRDAHRVLFGCSVTSPPGRPLTCSRQTHRASARGLRVTASLRTPIRVVTTEGY